MGEISGDKPKIPVLKPDMELAAPNEAQPEADATSRKLYEDTTPGVVKIETNSGSGSGFFIDKEGTIVTAAHVVLGSKEHFALTKDGTRYKLMIEKMDDINDLAIMRPIGIAGKVPFSFNLGESKGLAADQNLYALGHPQGLRPAYISPGYFRNQSSPLDLISKANPMAAMGVAAEIAKMTPKEQADAQATMTRDLVHSYLHIRPGNSGGPLIDADKKIVGVNDMINAENPSESYFVPVERIQDLLNNKTDKFNFSYTRVGEDWTRKYAGMWHTNPSLAVATTGSAAILGYGGYRFASAFPKLGGAAGGLAGLVNLTDDAGSLLSATDSRDTLKYGLASGMDLTTIAGGIASFVPKARTIGLVAMGVGLAGRAAADFIPSRLVLSDISRTDGDVRAPFNLQGMSTSKEIFGNYKALRGH